MTWLNAVPAYIFAMLKEVYYNDVNDYHSGLFAVERPIFEINVDSC